MRPENSINALADKICSVTDHPYVDDVRSEFNSGAIGILGLFHSIAKYATAEPHLTAFSHDPAVVKALDDFRSGRIDAAAGANVLIHAANRLL